MHSTSKVTWPDSTSAAERGSVITGSGRAQAARPPTASGRSITGHSVSPSRTGRGPFTQPQPANMARWAGAKPRWDVSLYSWPGEDDGGGEEDRTEVGTGILVVAGGDAAPLFRPAEPALDGVAFVVEAGVELRR